MTSPKFSRSFLISVVFLGATLGTVLDTFTVNYTIPVLTNALHATPQHVQWILASFSVTFTIGLISAGRIGDRFGRKLLLILGLTAMLAGLVCAVLANSIETVIYSRLLQGLGAGIASAQVLGIVQDEYEGVARVRALAAIGIAGTVAGILSPLLSATIVDAFPDEVSWRVIYSLSIPIIAITLVASFWYRQPEWALGSKSAISLDIPGIVVFSLLITVVTLPVVDPVIGGVWYLALAVGVLLLAVLIWWERRYLSKGSMPLFVPALFTSRGFILANLSSMLWYGAIIARLTVLTIYLLGTGHWSAIIVSLAFVPGSTVRVFTSMLSARMFRRFGYRSVTYTLTLETTAMLFLWVSVLNGARENALFGAVLTASVVSNFASGITDSILRANALHFAPAAHRGVAASFLQLAQRVATTVIIAVCTGVMLNYQDGGLAISVTFCLAFIVSAWVLTWGRTFSKTL